MGGTLGRGLWHSRCFECQVLSFCNCVSWWGLKPQRRRGSLEETAQEVVRG